MDWTFLLAVACVIAVLLIARQLGQVKPDEARALIKQGARIVDVRTVEEFRSGSIRGAVNVPLNELADRIESVVPDRATPVLLHCLSGARSGMGKKILTQMGYTQAHNLGSVGRARKIVEG